MTVNAGTIGKDAPAPRVRAGRPTAARAAEIEGLVRAAARRLFLEPGFEATNMDMVARAAGVSKGTLYARHAGKDALLLAVIEDLLQQLHLRASANDHSLPEELGARLHEYARRLVAVMAWAEYRQLMQLTQSVASTRPDLSWCWQEAALARYVDTLAADMASRGGPDAPWQHLASLLIHSVGGWYRSETASGRFSEARFEAYCTVVVDAILALTAGAARRSVPG
ncbi:MAG: TetR/AcrR family transcriptional regulator [Sphingomonadales bacterium]|nr:TetR/AcrR family transcriptional regulator [Sphingomonadales bacterium]